MQNKWKQLSFIPVLVVEGCWCCVRSSILSLLVIKIYIYFDHLKLIKIIIISIYFIKKAHKYDNQNSFRPYSVNYKRYWWSIIKFFNNLLISKEIYIWFVVIILFKFRNLSIQLEPEIWKYFSYQIWQHYNIIFKYIFKINIS